MLYEFVESSRNYLRAWNFLRRHELWKYALVPGLIGLLIWAGIAWAAYAWYDNLGAWIGAWYVWETAADWVRTIADVLSALSIVLAGVFLFKYLLLIAVSPFMSPLSERVEKILNPETQLPALNLKNILTDLIRGARINVRNVVRELGLTVLLLLLGFVPLFSPFVTVLIYAVQSYYAGFGNMDYVFERHYDLKQSVRFVRNHRGMAVGNGFIFLLILTIPLIGVFLAPPLATTAATLSVVPQLEESESSEGSTNL